MGERNGMSGKTVQRYIYLNDLVPELKELMDGGKLSFTPAVEVSRIRPKHQEYIAVSIEGQQSSPSKAQAKKLREMDEKNQLNPDVIDAVLSQEKKKEDFDVIISSAELSQFFGKDKTPREMKDQIMALLPTRAALPSAVILEVSIETPAACFAARMLLMASWELEPAAK